MKYLCKRKPQTLVFKLYHHVLLFSQNPSLLVLYTVINYTNCTANTKCLLNGLGIDVSFRLTRALCSLAGMMNANGKVVLSSKTVLFTLLFTPLLMNAVHSCSAVHSFVNEFCGRFEAWTECL
ncbi:hypothetical protein CEXT_12021 [Caerostris extrusa]|uniref:Secreted protein n=1 Tax=Caerostris extrusa TaxID=172846 RepID=A0AAV4Y900_CAEEX|nr:hypothetical protein CEXT_12021 [Caerostris extrusa]